MALSYAWDTSENRTGLMKLPPRKPVTDQSIARIKRHQNEPERNYLMQVIGNLRDPIEEDTLVDSDTLYWAYIEAGTIQSIGCLVCYFFALNYHCGISLADAQKFGAEWGLPDSKVLIGGALMSQARQKECLAIGQSSYYLALMIQQCFNLFICKARLTLPFGKFMFENPKNFIGLFGGAGFVFMVVYLPPLNIPFGTSLLTTPWVWLIAFGFGVLNFIYASVRFIIIRASNPIKYTDEVQGLDLHPTRFSTGR